MPNARIAPEAAPTLVLTAAVPGHASHCARTIYAPKHAIVTSQSQCGWAATGSVLQHRHGMMRSCHTATACVR